ncbi:MAG: transposase [Deltaproteobacteria bacterium]|nr:transposase [Deltaproteobacteria bacterium]
MLDGVFAPDATGALRFEGAPAPTDREVARLLATIVTRVDRLLRRRGLAPDEDASATVDPVAEDAPLLAALSRASVAGTSVLGRRPGAPVLRVGRDPDAPWVTSSGPRHAHLAGFDLHANRTVCADDRAGLERLCQYIVRPPLAQERLALLPDGRVCCTLAHPWSDGTRALLFAPIEFLEKLAVLVPRPRINLLLYHGLC